ncbi:hypothetical protein JL735_10450 [Bifidobacterium longum subsp. longum]|uniref:hypothetical protein n=1 Tax=Bifidobacterium longum TaxID=216816 RepID=UPI001926A860|nr:hypothetical protein [Bifidobacterium longum]MBL3909331.1 hypothetical protein [Bifidobacterium longum subsp. longum]
MADDSAQRIAILSAEIQRQILLYVVPSIVRQLDATAGDEITVIISVFIEARMPGHHAAHVDVHVIIFNRSWRMALIAQFLCPVIHGQWEQFDLPDHRDFPVVIRQRRKALAQIIPVTATCWHISGSLKTLPIFLAKPMHIQFAQHHHADRVFFIAHNHCIDATIRAQRSVLAVVLLQPLCNFVPCEYATAVETTAARGILDHGSVMRGLAVQLVFIVGFHGRNAQRRIIRKNAWTSHDSAP